MNLSTTQLIQEACHSCTATPAHHSCAHHSLYTCFSYSQFSLCISDLLTKFDAVSSLACAPLHSIAPFPLAEACCGTCPRCPQQPCGGRCPRLNRTEVLHSHRTDCAGKVGMVWGRGAAGRGGGCQQGRGSLGKGAAGAGGRGPPPRGGRGGGGQAGGRGRGGRPPPPPPANYSHMPHSAGNVGSRGG